MKCYGIIRKSYIILCWVALTDLNHKVKLTLEYERRHKLTLAPAGVNLFQDKIVRARVARWIYSLYD